jgi:hypothetical protein
MRKEDTSRMTCAAVDLDDTLFVHTSLPVTAA